MASYASQAYVSLVGIAILPLYLSLMGEEQYGLIGFFALLQAWFGLLDLGLSPTIARETARFKGGILSAMEFRQLFRALAMLFFFVAITGGLLLHAGADKIAGGWLQFKQLDISEVVFAVQIMAVSVALRWLGGLYRGVVTGSEQITWLSGFNALIATLRYIAVFASMAAFGFTVTVFFLHQLVVSVLEAIVLVWKTYSLLPKVASRLKGIGWSMRPVAAPLKFAATIAVTSSIWIVATQTDKLILSGILPLADYGYFSLAVLLASGVSLVAAPISFALMPRLARLQAESDCVGLIAIYRKSTRLTSIIVAFTALTLIICARPLLIAWTGNQALADNAASILQFYSAGNAFLALSALAFALQYARGELRFHLIGNAILVTLLLPSVIFFARNYGAVGAGWVWFCVNAAYLFGWIAYVHHQLEPGLNLPWFIDDILKPIFPLAILALLLFWVPFDSNDRVRCLIFCLSVGFVLLVPFVLLLWKLRRSGSSKARFTSSSTPLDSTL